MQRLFPLFILCFFLVACSEEEPPPPAPAKKVVAPAKASDVAGVVAPEQEQRYVYNPSGRRDPFQPLLLLTRQPKGAEINDEPLTPLQTYEIGQFRLIGIIVGKGESRALVVAPDGKSYILQRDIKIGRNGGKVTEVQREMVLVEERFEDFAGDTKTVIQEIRLPKREGV
jgi:type IV pilus assembly protein PilP